MAVELTGTPTYVTNTDYDDNTQAVTIPADCTAVVVFSWSWIDSVANDFDKLNWDAHATNDDFAQIVKLAGTGNPYDVWAYVMTSADGDWPGTGAQTLTFGFATTPTEGGTVVIVFVKGLDTASPTRSTDTQGGSADWTATLADVGGDDLSFIVVDGFRTTTIDAPGTGQTVLTSGDNENDVDWQISYELAEGGPSYNTTGGSPDYHGGIAFALKVAAAEGPWTINVSDGLSVAQGLD